MAALPDEALQQLAADNGFADPTLVSAIETAADGHGALVAWLNPAYPGDAPAKTKIFAKAQERYEQLAAGEVDAIAGQTLADVHAAELALRASPTGGAGGWHATPAQVAEATAQLNQALTDLYAPTWVYGDGPDGHGGLQAGWSACVTPPARPWARCEPCAPALA